MNDAALPLPGLEPPARPPSQLEAAVRRTIVDLDSRHAIGEAQSARTALAIALAQIIDDKRERGRTSTVANDARVLVELLDAMVPITPAGDGDDELKTALREFAGSVEHDLEQSVGKQPEQ